ncbi:MAG: hypothetical protein Q7R70_05695 [Candidatus Diapherotrites archaeon]|nr:hypothetical protein [Candidatus Diapherotrites archaeon]
MNVKGQESATFELLVVAVMGLAILVIVLGISNYFSSRTMEASERNFNDALKSAVNSPNGAVIVAEDIILSGGSKTSSSLSKQVSIPENCIRIQGSASDSWSVNAGGTAISISRAIQTNVYFSCALGDGHISGSGEACEISCLASFGEEITP